MCCLSYMLKKSASRKSPSRIIQIWSRLGLRLSTSSIAREAISYWLLGGRASEHITWLNRPNSRETDGLVALTLLKYPPPPTFTLHKHKALSRDLLLENVLFRSIFTCHFSLKYTFTFICVIYILFILLHKTCWNYYLTLSIYSIGYSILFLLCIVIELFFWGWKFGEIWLGMNFIFLL